MVTINCLPMLPNWAAIDQYKLEKCRRYISYEEMLQVIKSLGYDKAANR